MSYYDMTVFVLGVVSLVIALAARPEDELDRWLKDYIARQRREQGQP